MLSRGMMSFTLILMVVVPTILLTGLDGSTGTMVTPPEKQECDGDGSETLCLGSPTSNCFCLKGTYYKQECDSKNGCSTSCPSCPSDTFAPYVNRCTECRNVTVCKDNEQVVEKATKKEDKVCGCRDWPIPREVCERYNCTDLSGPAHPVLNTREPTPGMQERPDNFYSGELL
ncbi:uncharacterized protein LOC119719131 [Patiria miniata]|uniref:TNFR-Cys domain-containing protein n=1 Tax=Patiria miniata TaxID=46514 RepID=A0A913YXA1_PATMI|nr:uncharacterized protein LOC119719131 [Patiria miniata]